MKDFEYYERLSENIEFPRFEKLLESHRDRIDNTPMTAEERKNAWGKVHREANEVHEKRLEEYYKKCEEVCKEFFLDAREELKYTEYLEETDLEDFESHVSELAQFNGWDTEDTFGYLKKMVYFFSVAYSIGKFGP